jgi:hypothetical protein
MTQDELKLYGDKLAELSIMASSIQDGLLVIVELLGTIQDSSVTKDPNFDCVCSLVRDRIKRTNKLRTRLNSMLDGINKLYLDAMHDALPGKIELGRQGLNGLEIGGEW